MSVTPAPSAARTPTYQVPAHFTTHIDYGMGHGPAVPTPPSSATGTPTPPLNGPQTSIFPDNPTYSTNQYTPSLSSDTAALTPAAPSRLPELAIAAAVAIALALGIHAWRNHHKHGAV